MNEPTAQQDSSIPANKPYLTQVSTTSSSVDFWYRFRLFSLRFDRYCLSRWYFVIIGFYLIWFTLDLSYDLRFAHLYLREINTGFSSTKFELTDWLTYLGLTLK